MARSLKHIKNRIRSIENTEKVTRAMEMISVAKLNRIEHSLFAMKPYYASLSSILKNFLSNVSGLDSPFLKVTSSEGKIGLCLITSDSGLCGIYNNSIIRLADEFINKCGQEKIKLIAVGRKGFNYFKKRNIEILNSYIGLNGKYSEKVADGIAGELIERFNCGEVSQMYIAYTAYGTSLVHKPTIDKFLNIESACENKIEYILEPDKERILKELIPKYLLTKARLFILESFTSEHAARTVAMKLATDNAKELLEKLVLLRNKVRQANITQEIMEVISSSEALKG